MPKQLQLPTKKPERTRYRSMPRNAHYWPARISELLFRILPSRPLSPSTSHRLPHLMSGIYTSPYSPWHTSPPLSPSLHDSDFDIRLVSCCCYLSSSPRVQKYTIPVQRLGSGIYSGAYQQHMTMSIADAAIKRKAQTQVKEYHRKLEWCSSFLICELRNYVGQVRGTLQSPWLPWEETSPTL